MAGLRFAEAAGALATGHLIFTGIGCLNAVVSRSNVAQNRESSSQESQQNARSGDDVVKLVARMYRGEGVDTSLISQDVSFTDPAVSCFGKHEVVEAFRALQSCQPEQLTEPQALPDTSDGRRQLSLHQRYFAGKLMTNGVEVRSTLVVRVAPDGRVQDIEERWNGEPLLWWPTFRWARRVNGMISSLVTPLLLP